MYLMLLKHSSLTTVRFKNSVNLKETYKKFNMNI